MQPCPQGLLGIQNGGRPAILTAEKTLGTRLGLDGINKGDFCLIGPFMSHITHAQMFCYSKFKMAARSGNLHADRYLTICARIVFAFRTQHLSTIKARRIQAKKCVI